MNVSDLEAQTMALCVCERLKPRAGKDNVEFDSVKGVACNTANSEVAKVREGRPGGEAAVSRQAQRANTITGYAVERGDASGGIEVKLVRGKVGSASRIHGAFKVKMVPQLRDCKQSQGVDGRVRQYRPFMA